MSAPPSPTTGVSPATGVGPAAVDPAAVDAAQVWAFAERVLNDMSGALASLMCTLGDRLGLFRELAANGPASSAELAARTGMDERYLREWLNALASAGYVEHAGGRFVLPPAHAAVLAAEGQPAFVGGGHQQLAGLLGALDQVADGFRSGQGVEPSAYGDDLWEGMRRTSAGWFDNLLVREWVPAVPGLLERLERGARVADVGCGSGRALIRLAQAFPKSEFVGYELLAADVERARAAAGAAGVAGRVRLEARDVAAAGLPGRYDLITAFDVLHDIANPAAVLERLREALEPAGTCLVLEINAAEDPLGNVGPVSTLMYGTSVLFCLPTALAAGAPGLGTLGLPEGKLRALCRKAGFATLRRVPIQSPFNALYEVRA